MNEQTAPSVPEETVPFQQWPKVELHRHLEGSVRFETAWQWARKNPALAHLEQEKLRRLIEFDGVRDFAHFLGRFRVLRQLYTAPDAVRQVAREAVEDAALENIRYLELRFSPDHFASHAGFDMEDVASWILEAARAAAHDHGVEVRFLLTIARNYDFQTASRILSIALRFRDLGIVGLDLAGNELMYPAEPFVELFVRAREEGLGITVHAGEAGTAAHVWEAIDRLGAHRIGHGIRSADDPKLLEELRRRNISLEVCLTSNVQTGVVPSLAEHPLPRLLEARVPVVLCSDDPRVSRITLTDEWYNALQLGLSVEALTHLTMQAVEHTFLPADEKRGLRQRLAAEIASLIPGRPS